ncbi:MAG TPA: type II toxin-antitoxin system RelE/ParE family toxin [Agitococcus sp.]|uniref:type II toxin-antitoxin system RelE family toxin n=1 Tax=uncultured Agitococcus sp. TaxID=1506599 RepID=UPI00261BD6CF|nr:type II toxin-antitoxin system RelE/ParE family toxin [uncultured Agitococcus sp.]HMU87776.1 type II toxin-antitoxin system RelE/ParE family toxin [Agitococcus sp.]HNA21148.1 type II toxin-antitoxin system RelE/ParE family toxin [Agitococcus sp.]HQV23941.1 type II toxin-antitoxin system RelE/ParE family toxin [Agitococcus sp.]HRH90454.1 type II toxin-antitoxin system RelE/ParE family toxin [Agitococcus sp.]
MTYKLKFLPSAWKEWQKLAPVIQTQFKKKLLERLENPKVPVDKLSGYESVYKIKLRTVGYRLAYEVNDGEITVLVLIIGKRENNEVYDKLKSRIKHLP